MPAVSKKAGSRRGWDKVSQADPLSERALTILYVEDDPSSQMLIQHAFGLRSQWQLLTASSIEAAMALLHRSPDVILLDINLPDGRGYDLLNHLKADMELRHIPVIAVTSCAMRQQVDEGLSAGFFQYLVKPVDLNHLFAAIDAAVV